MDQENIQNNTYADNEYIPLNVRDFYTKEAVDLIKKLIERVKKKHKYIITPQDLAIELLICELPKSKDQDYLNVLYTINEIIAYPEIEHLEVETTRYIFFSPQLKLLLINAYLEAQKEGITDINIRHLTASLYSNVAYEKISNKLKDVFENKKGVFTSKLGEKLSVIGSSEKIEIEMLESRIKENLVGQDEAVKAVVRAIKRSRTILKSPTKPIGTFLFLGPTGVGKTELAKTLAKLYFQNEKSFVRVDMSEYSEQHSTQKLIGSPPGYIGYEQGGQLTSKILQNPFSLVLFDEIEKADKKIFNLFLQLIDDARLTDSQGNLVDFSNTILIFTSNIGANEILDEIEQNGADNFSDNKNFYESIILPMLVRAFSPEFVNRFEDIVLFKTLTPEQIREIATIKINKIIASMKEKGINISIKDSTFEKVVKEGYDPRFGARPLEREINREIIDPITDMILDEKIKEGSMVSI